MLALSRAVGSKVRLGWLSLMDARCTAALVLHHYHHLLHHPLVDLHYHHLHHPLADLHYHPPPPPNCYKKSSLLVLNLRNISHFFEVEKYCFNGFFNLWSVKK